MTATITSPLRRFILDEIKGRKDSNGDKFYAAIGRSQEWNATDVSPTPDGSYHEERDFRNNMQSVKLITDASFVVPRYNWSSGTFYDAYDDQSTGNTSPYYVINSNSVSSATANKFQSANFMPVEFIDKDSAGGVSGTRLASFSSNQTEQLAIQEASILGQVVGYAIDNPGSGYGSAPTLTITGDGSSASATATISGGAVVKVEVTDSSTGVFKPSNMGSGYNFASVTVSGGSPDSAAIIRPILNTLTVLNFASINTAFEKDQVITGGTSGAKAIVDFDSTGSTGVAGGALFIHQTDSNGFTPFTTGETITASGGSNGVLLGSSRHDSSAEVDPNSGQLLYVDNRSAITRASGQTEDLKIVIQV